MPIARDHQAREWRILRPESLHSLRHRAAGLARAKHQRAAFGWRRQKSRCVVQRQSATHSGLIQMHQKFAGLHVGIGGGINRHGEEIENIRALCRFSATTGRC